MTETNHSTGTGKRLYYLLTLLDILIINAAFAAVLIIYHVNFGNYTNRIGFLALNIAYIPVGLWIRRMRLSNYTIQMQAVLINALKVVAGHAACFLGLCSFLHLEYRFKLYVILYGMLAIAVPLAWIWGRSRIKRSRRLGHSRTNIVIIGTGWNARRLANAMRTDAGFGINILGYFDNEMKAGFSGNFLGTIEDFGRYMTENKVDSVYFAHDSDKTEMLSTVARITEEHLASFYFVPRLTKYLPGRFELGEVGPVPVLALRPTPLRNPFSRIAKRAFDIVFSSIFLIFSPLIFIPVAIAIKRSSKGPVFFVQERTGYKGKTFKCLKFRTMKVNADADKAQATADDPRKTKIGDFLRRTSIDELPQFINVLKGDMSVVGPRPH
ncbi:MAG: sugar transferase, partial [Muribaculaceae bacterium]|nr:sugar transferase [Muribaculaceae bacterium]